MITFSPEAINYIKDLEIEVEAIKHSFSKTLKDFGPSSYKPFAVFFSDSEKKSFVVTSRNVTDAYDFYTAISEMLFAYSANSSNSVLFALDANKEISGSHYDVLEIYMACEDFCYIFSYPYSLDSNNDIKWFENMFNVYEIEKLEQAYDTTSNVYATMEIIEVLYLHVHLRKQFFDLAKIKSFFDHNGFEYADINKKSENFDSLSL